MSTVVGLRPVSFTDPQSKKKVEGMTIFLEYPLKTGQGVGTDKVFLSNWLLDQLGGEVPGLNTEIEIQYNKYGKVAGFRTIG